MPDCHRKVQRFIYTANEVHLTRPPCYEAECLTCGHLYWRHRTKVNDGRTPALATSDLIPKVPKTSSKPRKASLVQVSRVRPRMRRRLVFSFRKQTRKFKELAKSFTALQVGSDELVRHERTNNASKLRRASLTKRT